jgi:hypothetical protein
MVDKRDEEMVSVPAYVVLEVRDGKNKKGNP